MTVLAAWASPEQGFLNLPHRWRLYLEPLLLWGGGGGEGASLYTASPGPFQYLRRLLASVSGRGTVTLRSVENQWSSASGFFYWGRRL